MSAVSSAGAVDEDDRAAVGRERRRAAGDRRDLAVRNRQHVERRRRAGAPRPRPGAGAARAGARGTARLERTGGDRRLPPRPPRPAPGTRVVKSSAVPVELMAPRIFSVGSVVSAATGGRADDVDLARAGVGRGRRRRGRCRRRRRQRRRVNVPVSSEVSCPWRDRGSSRRALPPWPLRCGGGRRCRRRRFPVSDLRAVGRERRARAAQFDDERVRRRRSRATRVTRVATGPVS